MYVIGVVSALKSEASCVMNLRFPILKIANVARNTRLCLSSMGNDAAHIAADRLLDFGCEALVSFGVAAALDKKLIPGDLVLAESIIDGEESFPVSEPWRNRLEQLLPPQLTVVGGSIAKSSAPLTSAQEKLALGEVTGACAADMESAAIARVAAEEGVPFIAIRVIVDPIEFSPPDALLSAVYPDGAVDILRLISLLMDGSVRFKTLWHLGLGMYAARTTLRKVVQVAGMKLACDSTDSDRYDASNYVEKD
jgi:adenosylhomocysteine nucleosidase